MSFDGLAGLFAVKQHVRDVMHGRKAQNAVIWIDEIEKAVAGKNDMSGIAQDQIGQLLEYMANNVSAGLIFLGHPGTGKSAVAKWITTCADRALISLDAGSCKGSLVGESERKWRAALSTMLSVARGNLLMIATCNKEAALPPELKRRFRLGTFFMDLPNEEERDGIWAFYLGKMGSKESEKARPDDANWTGAEISACCDVASRTGLSVVEAGKYIVPVYQSAKEQIDALRQRAVGRFLSASHAGTYQLPKGSTVDGRKFL
jgi:SpoVK/Ycf46/Vps4 family AAA+-type ATPase